MEATTEHLECRPEEPRLHPRAGGSQRGLELVERTTVGPVGQWFKGEIRGW